MGRQFGARRISYPGWPCRVCAWGLGQAQTLIIDPTLAYSTYLGGSGDDTATSIAVQGGLIYVAGRTISSNFPSGSLPTGPLGARGNYDAFVSKLDPNQSGAEAASLILPTYLTGSTNDEAWESQ